LAKAAKAQPATAKKAAPAGRKVAVKKASTKKAAVSKGGEEGFRKATAEGTGSRPEYGRSCRIDRAMAARRPVPPGASHLRGIGYLAAGTALAGAVTGTSGIADDISP